MKNISIYGIGNFGYALLKHLDNKNSSNFSLSAFDRNTELVSHLNAKRSHLYFHKGVCVSENIDFVSNIDALVKDCDVLILAISSNATNDILVKIKSKIKPKTIIVNTAKALDYTNGRRLSEVVADIIGSANPYALIAGGTIAKDLFQHEPLGIDVACENKKALGQVVALLESDNLSVYPTTDLLGVEYASAFKNVVAILAGIVNGLGFSYGSETHIISRLAQSIGDILVSHYGASPKTFSIGSQSWGSDLWMSCTGNTRNREFGILLGSGKSAKDAIEYMHSQRKTVEGINTIKILDKLQPLMHIKELELLYKLIVTQEISIELLRNYLLGSQASNY